MCKDGSHGSRQIVLHLLIVSFFSFNGVSVLVIFRNALGFLIGNGDVQAVTIFLKRTFLTTDILTIGSI